MRCLIQIICLTLLTPIAASANPTALKVALEGVAILDAAEKLQTLVKRSVDATDNKVITLFNGVDLVSYYGETLTSDEFESGSGLLFDVTVLESSDTGRRYVLPPTLVGEGDNADDTALRGILGARLVKHETFGADLAFLKKYDEIASLPGDISVSDKSRAIWVFKNDDSKFSFFMIEDSKSFWEKARARRKIFILQASVIKALPEVVAIQKRSEQYADLAEIYRDQIHAAGISGQMLSLQAARAKAAGSLADALQKLDQAQGIMKGLQGIQIIQDLISVASIVNNAAASAANSAQLAKIESEIQGLKGEMAELQGAIGNMQTQIDYFGVSISNISTQLNQVETDINNIYHNVLKVGDDVTPDAGPIMKQP